MEQETKEQREHRIITRTLDGFIQNYQVSTSYNERAKTDCCVRDFLSFLAPGNFEKYWDYYENNKNSEE